MDIKDQNGDNKKVDRRVVKTKRAIRNAFAQLLSKKSINEITIKDIADLADVNRKTVYNYYNGTYEILDEIENLIVSSYESLIKDVDLKKDIEAPYKIFESLTTLICSNFEFYKQLVRFDGNSKLVKKIVSALENRLNREFREKKMFSEDKVDFVSSYIIGGMLSAYQSWFLMGQKMPIKEFSKCIGQLVYNGTEALSQ